VTRAKCGWFGVISVALAFAIVFGNGWLQHQIPFYAWYKSPIDLTAYILMIASLIAGVFLIIGFIVWGDE
jgi:hypothetical protein